MSSELTSPPLRELRMLAAGGDGSACRGAEVRAAGGAAVAAAGFSGRGGVEGAPPENARPGERNGEIEGRGA